MKRFIKRCVKRRADRIENDNFIIAGPLTLNKEEKQAATTTGIELTLNEKEFGLLLGLAAREGETLALAPTETMAGLSEKVRVASGGFAWIEETPEGFTYKTNWARNKKYTRNVITKAKKRKTNNIIKALYTTAAMAAAFAFIVASQSAIPNGSPATEYEAETIFELDDMEIPLSNFNETLTDAEDDENEQN
jgi:hypothetical protein